VKTLFLGFDRTINKNNLNESISQIQLRKVDLHLEMLKHFNISMVLENSTINPEIGKSINKKFILFLKGNYRQLKFFDEKAISDKTFDLLGTIFDLVFA